MEETRDVGCNGPGRGGEGKGRRADREAGRWCATGRTIPSMSRSEFNFLRGTH